jgi:hypothetical protein
MTLPLSSKSHSITPSSAEEWSVAGPSDPHDPRHLPPAQQIALLTLRTGELAQACVSRLRADGAPSPNEMDYIALAQAGLSLRYSDNRRSLTPIGKYRADELAHAIAAASQIHVITYGRAAHSWFVRCSCGEFSASHPTAIRDPLAKVIASGGKHLAHVRRREQPEERPHV